jgi:hypothetical protein
MAATPVYGTIIMQGINGTQFTESFTTTDVANGYVTFDATGLKFWQAPEPVTVVDIQTSADGTDTKKWRFYVNGRDSGLGVRIGSVLQSINNRTPLPLKFGNPKTGQGAQLQIKELA